MLEKLIKDFGPKERVTIRLCDLELLLRYCVVSTDFKNRFVEMAEAQLKPNDGGH